MRWGKASLGEMDSQEFVDAVLVLLIGKHAPHPLRMAEIPEDVKAKANVADVFRRLVEFEILTSIEGGDGYQLSRPPTCITLLDVREAVAGRMEYSTEFEFLAPEASDLIRGVLAEINTSVRTKLAQTTLADLMA